MKIFISTSTFGLGDPAPLELLKSKGFDVELNTLGRTLKEGEVIPRLKYADGLIAGTEALTRDVLSACPGLKVISRVGTGLDGVDLQAAEELGIQVFNTPDAPTESVAELTVGLMLDLLRMISLSDRNIRAGIWKKNIGRSLKGKTIGVVGVGRIGKRVATLLKAFDCKVIGYDVLPDEAWAKIHGIELRALSDLLKNADIVTLHTPHSPHAQPLIDAVVISKMRDGAFVVNTSRGGCVDEKALYDALKSGALGGAALDVYESEPYEGPLKELDNVVLTSHIGACAMECRAQMEMEAAVNLIHSLQENDR